MNLSLRSPGRLLRLLVIPGALLQKMMLADGGKRDSGPPAGSSNIDIEIGEQVDAAR